MAEFRALAPSTIVWVRTLSSCYTDNQKVIEGFDFSCLINIKKLLACLLTGYKKQTFFNFVGGY